MTSNLTGSSDNKNSLNALSDQYSNFIAFDEIDIFTECKNLRETREKFSHDFDLFSVAQKQKPLIQQVYTASTSTFTCFPEKQTTQNIFSNNPHLSNNEIIADNISENIFPILEKLQPMLKVPVTEEMDVEKNLPMPGKGKKFLFNSLINSIQSCILIDTGSSTTIVSKSLVSKLNLKYYTSRLPINFLGMFGNKMVPDAKVAPIALELGTSKIAMPAFIMDSLPNGVDLIIGTDQLGKSIGIDIDLLNNFSISFFDSFNSIQTFRLGNERDLVLVDPFNKATHLNVSSKISNNIYMLDIPESQSCDSPAKLSDNRGGVLRMIDEQSNFDIQSLHENSSLSFQHPFHINFIASEDDHVLLSVRLEIENITLALAELKSELELLPSQLDQLHAGRNARHAKRQLISFHDQKSILIKRFNLLIEALSRELKRLKRKYIRKKIRLSKNVKREEMKKKKNILLNFITTKQKESMLVIDNMISIPKVSLKVAPSSISTHVVLELIIDNGLYSSHMNVALVADEILKEFSLDPCNKTHDHVHEEIINLVNVASQKLEAEIRHSTRVTYWITEYFG